jgi:small-conductance mechanosensitive channel/CRP-like cAMP-binding protein
MRDLTLFLAAAADQTKSSWVHHAPQTAGWAGVAAFCLLLALIALLPREQRKRALQPAIFLVLAGIILLLEEVVVESLADEMPAIALLFLYASIARSTFLLVVTLLSRVFQWTFQKIFLDIAMSLVYLAIGFAALSIAGVNTANLFTGSAIITVVLGLALQSTLGNIFAGLAIQMHQPFAIGDWIQFDDKREHIGKVRESNWRATTVVTLDEVEVVIPNNKLAELPLTNFNRPERWSRRSIYFVCPYSVPPRDVQRIVLTAIPGSFGVLASPNPTVVTNAFTERGVEYWLRFFTLEFDRRDGVDGGVRDRIWYALSRHGVTMPVAVHDVTLQQHSSETANAAADRDVVRREAILRTVPLFQALPDDAMARLAAASRIERYMKGEIIIRQGDEGSELFVVDSGQAGVSVRGTGDQDAHLQTLGPGAFFGEMSLLAGDHRAATVRAAEDCELVVIGKPALAAVFERQPGFVQEISDLVASRQAELTTRLAQLPGAAASQKEPLLTRVKRYFGMD